VSDLTRETEVLSEVIAGLFYKYPKLLVQTYYLVYNKEGTKTEISLSLGDKIVWVYLVSQFKSYTKANKDFFETLEQISEGSGVSKDTVKRFLVKLEEAKGLLVQQNKGQGFLKNNVYTKVLCIYELVQTQEVQVLDKYKQSIDLKRFTLTSNPNEKTSTNTSTQTNLVQQNRPIRSESKLTLAESRLSESKLNESLVESNLLDEDNLPDWAK
jgi:hypothetical protein